MRRVRDTPISFVMRKTPSYTGLNPASATSSKAKRSNRYLDTAHEVILRRELWRLGLRFRKNVKSLPGRPDIVFTVAKVAVFCDGDFWHGHNWNALKSKLGQGTNAKYWVAKIASNMERDIRNTALLRNAGWKVIRLWETDIKLDPLAAARSIKKVVDARRNKQGDSNIK